MAVNPKDKKMLQQNWDGAKESGGNLPDGTYQFKVIGARFHMSDKGKPQFKTKLELVGGDEELKGEKLEINDNLETSENMGWFKKKLRRLNIVPPEDVEEITDGTVADQMEGKVFEGQVKTKNDFMNVYVNRLINDGVKSEEPEAEEKAEKEETEEETSETPAIEEGSRVTWGNGKEGEVIEVLEDEEQARVKKDDESVVRVDLSKLTLVQEEEKDEESEDKEEAEDAGEESSEEGEFELPSAEDVETLKMPAVKKALSALDFDSDDMANPRGVLRGFCALAEDPKAKLNLDEVKPLLSALGLDPKKGEAIKDTTKRIAKAIEARIGG